MIIPAFNASRTIALALMSIASQTVGAYEIIVVDDGSTDNTAEICRRKNVKVISTKNQGPGAARNVGVREATGDIVMFLDADDTWMPTKIEKHLDAWKGNPFVPSFVFDQVQRVRSDGRIAGVGGGDKEGRVEWEEMFDHRNWTCGSSLSMRRDDYLKIGGTSTNLVLAEDVEIMIRAAKEIGPAYRIAQPLTVYNQSPHSLSRKYHSPHEVVRQFKERLTWMNPEQEKKLLATFAMTNALASPPGKYFSYAVQAGFFIVKDPRFPKFALLRLANLLGIRKL